MSVVRCERVVERQRNQHFHDGAARHAVDARFGERAIHVTERQSENDSGTLPATASKPNGAFTASVSNQLSNKSPALRVKSSWMSRFTGAHSLRK